jgi:hypothetical protein
VCDVQQSNFKHGFSGGSVCIAQLSQQVSVQHAVGRVLRGIATSLLYSAFEGWLVAEHFKHGFSGASESYRAGA